VVGAEDSVRRQFQAFLDAGATDIWAAVFGIGETPAARSASARRTTSFLRELLDPAECRVPRRLLRKAADGPGMAEVTDPCEVTGTDIPTARPPGT
jgi:hypothetical protein